MAWKRKWQDSPSVPTSEKEARKEAERERSGQKARRFWAAVQLARRAAGQNVGEVDLRAWNDLPDSEQEIFRRGADAITVPDEVMWAKLEEQRKFMGEKAFRTKIFELCVDIMIENIRPEFSEAERYRAVDQIVKLTEMLEVPSATAAANHPAPHWKRYRRR